jgi:hypothetical protein
MENSKIEELVRRAIKLHSMRGSSGLIEFAKVSAEAGIIANRITEYISSHFGKRPEERCWPGTLEREPHYTGIQSYLLESTN